MDFQLSEQQRELQAAARKFARAEMPAVADMCEETGHPPDREILNQLGEMGFLGVNIPESLGGLGLGNLEALLVLEEFAQISSASAFPLFEANVGPVHAIVHFASEALQRKIVPEVCRGNMVLAVSMSEPQAGSALTDLPHAVWSLMAKWCSTGKNAGVLAAAIPTVI